MSVKFNPLEMLQRVWDTFDKMREETKNHEEVIEKQLTRIADSLEYLTDSSYDQPPAIRVRADK